jgi:hypothetical protein
MTKTSLLGAAVLFLAVSANGCSSSTDDETPVGTVTVGAYSIAIHQEGSAVAPGATSRFVMKTASGQPASITGWIGIASGEGSVKKPAIYDAGDGDFDDDVVAPTPLPAGAQFWIEVVDPSGKKDVGSIAWKK